MLPNNSTRNISRSTSPTGLLNSGARTNGINCTYETNASGKIDWIAQWSNQPTMYSVNDL